MSVFYKNTRRVLSYERERCPTAAENGIMTKGVVSGEGGLTSGLRRVKSSPSQTLRCRLVRTTDYGRRRECSARRLPPFVAALFFRLRDSYG